MASKVLLIHPYVPMELQYGSKYKWAGAVLPPLGVLYVASALKKVGHKVEVLDANARGMNAESVLEFVQNASPDIVGMTGTSLSFNENLRIARLLKDWDPSVPIVLGGVHAQGDPEGSLSFGCIDYVIPNEGEITMVELVNAIEGSGSASGVDGVWSMLGGKATSGGPGKLVQELDSLDFPARHLLHDMGAYHQKVFGYRERRHTTIFTQRGCPFRCIFCSSSKQFREVFDKKIRVHSIEYVKNEIRHLQKNWGIKELYFVDDTFNLSKKRVHELCDMIIANFPGLKWSCNFEANICDEDLIKHMRQAGCWLIQMGVETGNEEIMLKIDKGITLDRVRNATELAAKYGMAIKTSFIIGNPGDTKETIEQTVQFAQSLPVHYITFSLMAPLPGTYFWNKASEYGNFDQTAYDKFSMISAAFTPEGLDEQYLVKAQQEAHKRVYLNFNMARRHLPLIQSFNDILRYTKGAATFLM